MLELCEILTASAAKANGEARDGGWPSITITLGRSMTETDWTRRQTLSFAELATMLSKSPKGQKDGPCYTPAVFSGKKRTMNQATEIGILVLDADCGHSLEEIACAVETSGY